MGHLTDTNFSPEGRKFERTNIKSSNAQGKGVARREGMLKLRIDQRIGIGLFLGKAEKRKISQTAVNFM